MTNNELAFKTFENLFYYEWYAQADGGNKTVIFLYSRKGDYRNTTRFEAESLEKAFNCAMSNEGLIPKHNIGKIMPFDVEAWNKLDEVDRFYSIGDKCWKSLSECMELERQQKYARFV